MPARRPLHHTLASEPNLQHRGATGLAGRTLDRLHSKLRIVDYIAITSGRPVPARSLNPTLSSETASGFPMSLNRRARWSATVDFAAIAFLTLFVMPSIAQQPSATGGIRLSDTEVQQRVDRLLEQM